MDIILIMVIAIILGSFGQIAFKHGMNLINVIGTRQIVRNLLRVFTNRYVILGVSIYALSSLLWLFSMTRLDISFMYPLVSLSYLITTIFAIIFLNEKVKITRWVGISLIMAGALLIVAGV